MKTSVCWSPSCVCVWVVTVITTLHSGPQHAQRRVAVTVTRLCVAGFQWVFVTGVDGRAGLRAVQVLYDLAERTNVPEQCFPRLRLWSPVRCELLPSTTTWNASPVPWRSEEAAAPGGRAGGWGAAGRCWKALTHSPTNIRIKFWTINFQANFSDWWLRHLLWNHAEMNITIPYWFMISQHWFRSCLGAVRQQATLSQCWPRPM